MTPQTALRPTVAPVLADFLAWREAIVRENAFACEPIDFADSAEWRFENGALRHRTGGFFSLVGLRTRARYEPLHASEQLIILQPEIAINGFLARRQASGGLELLFNARVEPGNVGAMQLAPTMQSTEANYKRLHGGKPTPLAEWFLEDGRGKVLFDERQSEEATRYYGKYNRNVVIEVPRDAQIDLGNAFRWYGVRELRELAVLENALNTDGRSVLCCLSWHELAGRGQAFAGGAPGSFRAALRDSHECASERWPHSNFELFHWLTKLRVHAAVRHQVIPLDQLANWVVERDRIREREREHGFAARHFRIRALGREVKGWDQPLIDSHGVGRLTLVCQRRNGLLCFLLKASFEIGYLEGAQLSTTLMVAPGESLDRSDTLAAELERRIEEGHRARTLLRCRQSEEGGRFYQDENDYELVELEEGVELPGSDHYLWLPLAQVKELVRISGMLSMELRGTLALLLHYL